MKNTFGTSVSITLFGESHGEAIGATLDGLCPGILVDEEFIASQLSKRRPNGKTDTPRIEKDEYKILSGVFNGKTTGTPITVVIPNENTRSSDYNYGVARPSHADYSAFMKYHGFEDFRGGGHFSGRITAPIVALGAIAIKALEKIGVKVGTHILSCGGVKDKEFCNNISILSSQLEQLQNRESQSLPTISPCEEEMMEKILEAKKYGDSIGGTIQTAILGIPAGVGEPWFDTIEGILSHAVFSIGGIKGIEFGLGFGFATMRGSRANDPFALSYDGEVVTLSNHNGGINGGITNGMPIMFNCAVKPTPSISQPQDTVNFSAGEETKLEIKGRHDPAIIRRICVVVDSVVAITLCDMLSQRYGTDIFLEGFKK